MLDEMKSVLQADMENQGSSEPCQSALSILEKDLSEFLRRYFVVPDPETDTHSVGYFSVTSR